MKLGISSDCLRSTQTIPEQLKQIAQAGFTHIMWSFEKATEHLYSREEMLQCTQWIADSGLVVQSVHGSHGCGNMDFLSPDESKREMGVALVKNRIELAEALGSHEVALHMYLPFEHFEEPSYKEDFYRQAFQTMDELMAHCKAHNVRLCLENLIEAPGCLQVEQYARLFEAFPDELLGLCLDTGHANLLWGTPFVEELAARFRNHIHCVHLHDNIGAGLQRVSDDIHRVPADPIFPWKEVMQVLKVSSYGYPLILEVKRPEEEAPEAFLARCQEAGAWLYSLQA